MVDRRSIVFRAGLAVLAGGLALAGRAGRTAPASGAKKKAGNMLVYVGTYTGGESKGIYIFRMDGATGMLTPAGFGPETSNPSFLAIHPNHRFLYAVNEVDNFNGTKAGGVTAFSIEPKSGALALLNQQSSRGTGPCYIATDREGKNVLVANYGGGSVAVLPVGADGRLGEATAFVQHQGSSADRSRQEGPHAHSINLDAANRYAFAADLGLDKILVYRFDPARGSLAPNDPPFASVAPKSGPRHFAFHPNGRYAYVINEMASTVTAFSYDARHGALKDLQTLSTLPQGFSGNNSTAEVRVSPDGHFLYGSNRGHNSIAIFAINPESGTLTPAGHVSSGGKTPRNFSIDPSGTFLLAAHQDSDTIVVFRIDPQTGGLTPTGQTLSVPKPVCVKFMPAG
jgi:6-phosphogluconolactonase